MVSQTGKKPPCGNTFAGRLPGRLHRKPGLSNRMPDPRKTIQSAARNFLGARRARRNTRRCARKNTCRRALSERCTTQRRKNAVRCACPKRPPEACPQHNARDMQRNRARRTRRNPCMATLAKRAPRGTTRAQPQDPHHARKTPPKVGTRPHGIGTRPPKCPPATQRARHAAESCILRRSTAQDCRAV